MGRVIDYDLLPAIFAASKAWPARQPGKVDCVHHIRDAVKAITSDGLDILDGLPMDEENETPWLDLATPEAMEELCEVQFANLPDVREVEPRMAPRGAWVYGLIGGRPALGLVIGTGALIARHDGGSRIIPLRMFTRAWRAD